uniref:Short wavelength opsin 2 n=1 Tax=Lebiasina panamensis TaxID=2099949 RepID=A0A6M4ZVL0_9TELE|nr:short wavelength opsin 2 [Piabucina panamensis]
MKNRQPLFHDDFHIPIPMDIDNISHYSPFLVPQDHLGGPAMFWAMTIFMFFVFFFGTIINSLTIICTIQYKKLRTHLNYILVNMAVANLIMATVGSSTTFISFYYRYFIFGPLICKIEGFVANIAGMVSLWSLAVVAIERWLVVCKPMANFTFKETHAIIGCVFTWFFASCSALPPMLGWSRYIPEGLQCSCAPDWYTVNNKYNNETFVVFLFGFCFAVPFTTILFCYSQLLFTIKSAAKAQADSASTQKAEREVTKMVVMMVAAFLVCFLPYAIFALWIMSNRGQQFDLRLATIPACFSKSATVYNPVIYVFMNKQFRACMMKLIFCGKSPFGDEDEASSSSQVTQVSSVGPEK